MMAEYIGYMLYPPIMPATRPPSTLPILPMVSTGKEPAPPLPFVPLESINQQLAAIRTITAMDTQHMGRRSIKEALPDLSGCTIEGAGPMKRMSVALPPEVAALLEQLATSQGVTQAVAIRMAIKTEAYLQGEIKAGCKVVLVSTDGTQREVVFR